MKPTTKNLLKLIAGVVAISFSPLAVKMVAMTPTVSAFYRNLYSAIFVMAWAFIAGERIGTGHNFSWVKPIVIGGIFLGVDFVLWHKTIIYLGVGPACFLGNSQILFVTLFAAFVFREHIPKAYYFFLALVMLGMYLLMPSAPVIVSRPLGYCLGLLVGASYSVMLISFRYAKECAGKSYPEMISLGVVFAFSTLFILVYGLIFEPHGFFVTDMHGHIVLLVTSFVCQTLGWYLIKTSITNIPSHEGSLMLILQPILATVWGVLFFAEGVRGVQLVGILMASVGIVIYQMKFAASSHTGEVE